MDSKTLPFNIKILKLDKDIISKMRPVTVLDIMDGKTNNFNPNGLFSVEIFGKVGEEKRNTTFSYIDLKTKIIHPTIYRTLVDLKSFYRDILAGKEYAIWNDKIKNFEKSNPVDGDTGYHFFMQHLHELKLERDNASELIQRKIKVVSDSIKNKTCFLEYLLVMPAGLRDYEIDKYGKPTENEINLYYRKVLSASHLINRSDPYSKVLDITRFKMQTAVLEIYEYLENLLKGKGKLIVGKWASRQIFNGTRNVITSLINDTRNLDSKKLIDINSTVVGLYQFLKSTLPLSMYHIRNGFLLNAMPGPNSPFVMTNKQTLKKELVKHNTSLYEQWMTNEGLEKTITSFGDESIRNLVLDTDTHYLYLVYKDDNRFMLLQDIDDLPNGFNKDKVYPITFVEVLYLSVYKFANKIPGFVTRYPVLGNGSIYPSMCYLKTTINSSIKEEYDSFGNPTNSVAFEYPNLNSKYMDTISPSISHIKRLSADFDGDTVSFNTVYSEQAINEVTNYLNSKRYYLNSNGKLTYSMSTDTIDFIVTGLTA